MNDDDDDDDDNLFEVRYLGGRLDNDYDDDENPRPLGVPDYIIPNVPFRLIIDVSVTEIDRLACYGCYSLTEIVFHENVTKIGRSAFEFCSKLERAQLPEGLLRVEHFAFDGCNSLRGEITIPASVQFIGNEVFYDCTSLQTVVFAPRTASIELGSGMFGECSSLQSVTLPHNIQLIPARFFEDCTSLTHLQLPVSVEQLGLGAFCGSAIQSIKILEQDEFIPGMIMLPPNLQSIPRYCFYHCKSLTHIRIPPSVHWIEAYAFDGSELRSITMLRNVHRIGREAFRNCAFLERATFHSTNLNMAHNIFVNCHSLTVIMIAPWLWPKLFASMNGHPEFIFQFFRYYQPQIDEFAINDGGGGVGDGEDGGDPEDDASDALSTTHDYDDINRVENHDDDNEDDNGNRSHRDNEDGTNNDEVSNFTNLIDLFPTGNINIPHSY